MYPILGYSQIPVVQGPNQHWVFYVFVDYNSNPTTIRVIDENGLYASVKNLIVEEVGSDTLAIKLFFWDCVSNILDFRQNETIVEAPFSLDSCFNVIIRTYKDTNSVDPECHQRDFYTLMDSVFINKCDTLFNSLSTDIYKMTKHDLVIYPNPVSNRLNVDVPNSNNILSYYIYNTYGKQLLTGKLEESIDISMLNKGMYIIRFENQSEGVTKRFIVN